MVLTRHKERKQKNDEYYCISWNKIYENPPVEDWNITHI